MELEKLLTKWLDDCNELTCPSCHSFCIRAVNAIIATWRALQNEPYKERDIDFFLQVVKLAKEKKEKIVVHE